MSAAARKHRGLMARTVREVLGTIFAPELRDRIFDDALRRAVSPEVPEDVDRARDFVEGPLRSAIVDVADLPRAEAVMEGLAPILEMAESHVRARGEATEVTRRSTIPVPPGEDAAVPRVLMATLDRTGIEGVARALTGTAEVRQVGDVFELVSGLDQDDHAPVLVIDCCLPAIDPATVATMHHLLPDRMRVILWGATERMRADLELLSPAARDFIACAADATHEDLAALLAALV